MLGLAWSRWDSSCSIYNLRITSRTHMVYTVEWSSGDSSSLSAAEACTTVTPRMGTSQAKSRRY